MSYYNRSLKKIEHDIKNMKFLNYGNCAQILHNENIIFKDYFTSTEDVCRLSLEIFTLLKDIDNPHLIKIFDIFYFFNFIELFEHKILKKDMPSTIDAYTAQYYPDDTINVLYEHIDYILDNFRELDKLFNIFSDNKICTDDVKRKNSILSHNGIIIIDTDTFYISNASREYIANINKQRLLFLFKNICYCAGKDNLTHPNICDKVEHKLVSDFRDIKVNEKTDIAYEISKKLGKVKRPTDYFIK